MVELHSGNFFKVSVLVNFKKSYKYRLLLCLILRRAILYDGIGNL